MITFGNTSIQISLIAIFFAVFAVKLLFLTVGIWFVVQGFRVHWGWGLANLLIPGAIIPFSILHFKVAKKPMILAGAGLALLLVLWACARHGSHSRPRVEVAPDLPASATRAILLLNLVSPDERETMSGSISLKWPFLHDGVAKDSYDEERLTAIRFDGFVMQFITRSNGYAQTNFVLFPYGQTTETNTLGWRIIGNYSDTTKMRPITSPEPAAVGTFRLLTTNGFTTPSAGSRPTQ